MKSPFARRIVTMLLFAAAVATPAAVFASGTVDRQRSRSLPAPPFAWEDLLRPAVFPVAPGAPEDEQAAARVRTAEAARKREWLRETAAAEAALTRGFDALHYALDIHVDPAAARVSGAMTMTARVIDTELSAVVLDLQDNMTVQSVTLLGPPDLDVTFSRGGNLLRAALPRKLALGDVFALVVVYDGAPAALGFGSFTFETHNGGDPIISTLSEPRGARSWWPCKDEPSDKATADVMITVPHPLIGVSNGMLQGVTANNDGTRTYHWKESYPLTTYLVFLAISNYKTFEDTYYPVTGGEPVPVTFFVYKEHLAEAKEDFSVTVPMMTIFSSFFGEYPFAGERYGMAVFPWGGAMEHQTCTSYGAPLVRGDHLYDYIVAHELAHQWWGDEITCAHWEDIWLNEGFATWSEAIWAGAAGRRAYNGYMADLDGWGYFTGALYANPDEFGYTVYHKGAWAAHMLRGVLGDERFTRALEHYQAAAHYDSATSEDLRRACEEEYGAPLDWFFEEWVYGKNRPEYTVAYDVRQDGPTWGVNLEIRQTQQNAPLFTMPIEIGIGLPSGDERRTVMNSQAVQKYHFTFDEAPTRVDFDPDGWILKYASPASAPDMDVNGRNYPDPIWLGQVKVGNDLVIPLPIESRGGSDLVIYDIVIWAWGAPELRVFNPGVFPLTIPPGTTSLDVKLRYAPRWADYGGATLVIFSNDESPDLEGTLGVGRYYVSVVAQGVN